MNQIFKSTILIFSFLLLLNSCNEKIEIIPNNSIDKGVYLSPDSISWISSAKAWGKSIRIAQTTVFENKATISYLTDSKHNDYKPVISPDGKMIAFFRSYNEHTDFSLWNTSICVMNIDGSNFKELTGNNFANFEPYWTRDGSNRIVWSRYVNSSEGKAGTYVYWTGIDAEPGDEERISDSQWEWSNSCLKDGRIFVKKNNAYYLMTPKSEGKSEYQKIDYPDSYHYLHKASISNDETLIAYMKSEPNDIDHYKPAEIVYANFNSGKPAITGEIVFVPKDSSKMSWYVSISPCNKFIMYAEDGKIMMHDVEKGENIQIEIPKRVEYRYPTFLGTCK